MIFEVFMAGKTSVVIFCAMAGSSQYFTRKTLLPSYRCKQTEAVRTPKTWPPTHPSCDQVHKAQAHNLGLELFQVLP
jgi:hypothetical protein